MASPKEYLDFVLEQLSELDEVSLCRKQQCNFHMTGQKK